MYTTAFDLIRDGCHKDLVYLFLLGFGILSLWFAKTGRVRILGVETKRTTRTIWMAAGVFSCVLGLAWWYASYRQCVTLRRALQAGAFEVTEGIVHDWNQDEDGGDRVSFRVGAVAFGGSGDDVIALSHRDVVTSGRIRDGVRVRVSHVGGAILRLEVWDEEPEKGPGR